LATLAYRGGSAIGGLPNTFSDVRLAPDSRTAGEILSHICDLLDWALITAKEQYLYQQTQPQTWERDVERFFTALAALDAFIAGDSPLQVPVDKLFQGPVADALTHVGQIAMLRRLAEAPQPFQNYFRADIVTGKISQP
jgi:hypothetical protein